MNNVLEFLENSVSKYPDKIAISDGSESFTFTQIYQNAKKIGSLLSLHTEIKQPVLVLVNRSALTLISYLGVLYAGCYFIPLETTIPLIRLQYLIDFINPSIIFVIENKNNIISNTNYNGIIININEANTVEINENELKKRVNQILDIDPMCVIFTSGSTGNPKGVVLSHRSMISRANAAIEQLKLEKNDIFARQSTLSLVAALRTLFATLNISATYLIIPSNVIYNPVNMFEFLNNNNASIIALSSTSISWCTKADVFKNISLTSVKIIFFTGSAVKCEDLKIWMNNLPDVTFINSYGLTETGTVSYYIIPHSNEYNTLPVGKKDNNTDIYLFDEDNNLVKDGEIGEISVKGPKLATCYYKNNDLNKAKFIQIPDNNEQEIIFKTGDFGFINNEGLLILQGRKDRMVKCMNYMVELDEIERAANTMSGIEDSRSLYNKETDMLYLFYTGTAEYNEIRQYLRGKLPTYMIPHKFVMLEEIPLLNENKADYEKLKRMM